MAYGRETLMNALRKVGDLDAQYATAVRDRFGNGPVVGLGAAVPIRDVFGQGRADTLAEKALLASADAGILTSNVAARYALPAGGVTAAGVGLYELAQALSPSQQSSEAVMP